MMQPMDTVLSVVKHSWRSLLFWGLTFAVFAQTLQLAMLIIRFGDLPNYGISYDWLGNISTIAQSTPSIKDMLPIMFEEWWIEIGFMNYDYGNGISEWSLNVIPSRLVILTILGGLLALLILLKRNSACDAVAGTVGMAGASVGSVLVCMTTAAMSWVVCCATPSWVVGLAMLGLSVSASLALEDLGPTLFFSGFAVLLVSIYAIARGQAQQHNRRLSSDKSSHELPALEYTSALNRT